MEVSTHHFCWFRCGCLHSLDKFQMSSQISNIYQYLSTTWIFSTLHFIYKAVLEHKCLIRVFSECCNLCFHHKILHFITSIAQQNGILVKLRRRCPALLHLSKEICLYDGTESIALVCCLVDLIDFSYGREFVLKNADCKKMPTNQNNLESVLIFWGFWFGFFPGLFGLGFF